MHLHVKSTFRSVQLLGLVASTLTYLYDGIIQLIKTVLIDISNRIPMNFYNNFKVFLHQLLNEHELLIFFEDIIKI